jgi:Putative adhesin
MRAKLLFPALAAALLGTTACDFEDLGGFERYHKDFHYSYPLKSGGRLAVETFNGSVEVSGWDQDTVDISGTKYSRSQEEADSLKIEIDNSPDLVSIRVVRPSMRRGNWGARFVIKVPRQAVLERITTSNGAIRTMDGAGPARLKSSNGQIHVQAFRGNLDAQTSNDPIELLDVEGDVKAHSSNGHIRVDGLRGSLDAGTSNSSIHARLERTSGPLRLESSNGSIDVALPPDANVAVRANTSNNSVTLHAPGTVNARLAARTSNGSITSDFELRMQGEFDRHHMDGVIGTGGPLIDLSTSNGNIRLLKM